MKNNESLNVEIATLCKQLKLPEFYQEFQRQETDSKMLQCSLPCRLKRMLQAEVDSRKSKRLARLLKESGIKDAMPDISRITYESSRNLDQSVIEELALCEWITGMHGINVIITGMAGTGKTWLAKALAKEAIKRNIPAVYWRAALLIDRIQQARSEQSAIQFRNRLNAKPLLVIDDFAMTPMDDATRDDFFSFLDERGQSGASLIIASQRQMDDWYAYIGDKYHADAIMDRLHNNSYVIELKGASYRERTANALKVKKAKS